MSRRELLTLLSAVMALMALGLDTVLPAFDEIRATYDLGEDSPRTGRVITSFFFGLAAAQLFFGPLADRFGRKPVLYAGGAIYVLGAAGSALAPTFELLLVSRFVWGVGAAGARVVATSIVRDRFVGGAMASAMSQIMAVFMLVPVLAPSLGSGLIAILPWRSVFWFCVFFALIVGLWSLRLRESLDPANRRPLSVESTIGGYTEVARTPVTAGYTVATIFIQAVFTTYLASSELIIGEVFGRKAQFPLIFGAVAVFFAVAAIVNGRIVERVGIHRLIRRTSIVVLGLSAALLAVSLESGGRPEFWVFMPLLALTLSSFMMLMPNLNTATLTPVGHLAGTASALSSAIRMAGGAVLGTIASSYISDSTTPFAVTIGLCMVASAITVYVVQQRSPQLDRYEAAEPTMAPSGV